MGQISSLHTTVLSPILLQYKVSSYLPKALANDASRRVCLLGIKIRGGTGIIEAFDIQRYFRRTKAAELAFGDGDFHREIVAQERELN